MRYDANGRMDLTHIVVYDYEVFYALGERDHTNFLRVRHNIALGKACGAYDPEPALRWLHERERRGTRRAG